MNAAEPIRKPGHIPALDGVRGIAILLILFHHATMNHIHPKDAFEKIFFRAIDAGWVGVDLFFVLSGFLITGILVDAKGASNYFSAFYMRRVLRIFPLYYAVLVLFFLVMPFFGKHLISNTETLWFWFYGSNIWTAVSGWPPKGIAHFWSLAIEEQFYIVWPLVVYLVSRRKLVPTLIGILATTPLIRLGVALAGYPEANYVLTTSRMDALAFGGLLAMLYRTPEGLARWNKTAWIAFGVAALAIVGTFIRHHSFDRGRWNLAEQALMYSIIGICSMSFMALVMNAADNSWLKRLCMNRMLRTFGKFSYCIYIIHVLVNMVFRHFKLQPSVTRLGFESHIPSYVLYMVVHLPLVLALGWLSWHVYEKRFLKYKDLYAYKFTPDERSKPAASPEMVSNATAD